MTRIKSKLLQSHIKLLEENGVDISQITNANVKVILDSLTRKNKQPLSGNYKISILQTIKFYNKGTVTVTGSQLNIKRNRNRESMTREHIAALVKLVNYAYNYKFQNTVTTETRSLLDTLIAIILTVSSNSKISTLVKLQVGEYEALKANNETIVSKAGGVKLIAEPSLLPLVSKKLDSMIAYRNKLYQLSDNDNNFLLSCSTDIINKRIRELVLMLTLRDTHLSNLHIGMRSVELLNRDILLQNLQIDA